MSEFVLDNSVAMRWLLESPKQSDQKYAEEVLKSFIQSNGVVPNLWHLEASNVLLGAEKRKEVTQGEVEAFLVHLENLPIDIDYKTCDKVFNRTTGLAKAYKLSSYDAAYLELAIRQGAPLATLDKDLIKAAKKAQIDIYLKPKISKQY